MQLSYDTLQLAGMLYLTGGITNPFSLLLIAPAVLAAATLPSRHALVIGSLTLLASLLLTVMPLHSGGGWPSPPPTNWARRWPQSLLSRGKWRARPSPTTIGQTPS